MTPLSSGPPSPRPAVPDDSNRPVVVYNGLTFRDLQRAIFMAAALVIVFHLAEPLTTLLLFFLLVFILAAVLNPLVVKLERHGVPRMGAAVLLAAAIVGGIGIIGWLAIPPLATEVREFADRLPKDPAAFKAYYQDQLQRYPALKSVLPPPDQVFRSVSATMGAVVGRLGRYLMNVVVGLMSMLLLLVLVIFTVGQPRPLLVGLLAAAPLRHRDRVESAMRRILEQLKNWAFGSLMLGVIVGVATGVGLWVLGLIVGKKVPYILLFSVLAGVGELIPNIGPVISAVPPALLAFTVDPKLGFGVLILFVIIQQLENNLIVPLVMGQSLNLHPLSVTFMVLVMGALFGLLGAIMAVPVCAITKVLWEEFYLIPQETDMERLEKIADDIVADAPPTDLGKGQQPGDSSMEHLADDEERHRPVHRED